MENVKLVGITATTRNKVKPIQGIAVSMANYIFIQVKSFDTTIHVIFAFLLYALATTSSAPTANKF